MSIWVSSSLCEEEIEELRKSTIFTVVEIESLYERFKYLDKSSSGFLTFVEFQMIPEFYSNPFCNLIMNYLESINSYEKVTFNSYLQFLSIFNVKTSKTKRISFLFSLFDLEKRKKITKKSLLKIHSLMANNKLDLNFDKNAQESVDEVLRSYDIGNKGFLDKKDFELLYNSDPSLEANMVIDISRLTNVVRGDNDFMRILWPTKNK